MQPLLFSETSVDMAGVPITSHDLAWRFFKKFGNKWNSPDFPINGIQAIFHEIKRYLGIILIYFHTVFFDFMENH
jgi:hypothetical protein